MYSFEEGVRIDDHIPWHQAFNKIHFECYRVSIKWYKWFFSTYMKSSESEERYVPGGEHTYMWTSRWAIALILSYLGFLQVYKCICILKITALSSEHMYFTCNITYRLYCSKSELHTNISQFKYSRLNLHIYIPHNLHL